MNISESVFSTLIKWIDERLYESITLDDLVNCSGYSKCHLRRIFIKYSGLTPGKYIKIRRLYNAAKELRNTKSSINDVCSKYGFDSQQSFTRVFKKAFNIPPGAYRKKWQ